MTARLTVAGKHSSLTWTLTFKGLSSAPIGAAIYFGAPGKTGPLAMLLCTRCTSGGQGAYRGPYVSNREFVNAILAGQAYATIRTKRNPGGEIRGQLKASRA